MQILRLALSLLALLLLTTLQAVEAGNLRQTNVIGQKDTMSYSFSLKVADSHMMGQDGQLLFWSEGWNVLGLMPSSKTGKTQLIAFLADDVPSSWAHAVDIEDERWYKVKVDFVPSTGVTIWVDGKKLGTAAPPTAIAASSAILSKTDVFNFDFAEQWTPKDAFELYLDGADASGNSKGATSGNQSDCANCGWLGAGLFNWYK